MSKVRAQFGGSVLCAIEVTPEEISAYGVFDVEPVPGADKDVLKVNGMVEKPNQRDAPSLYAAAGRYILDRAIFDALQRIERGVGGEMQLTDAIALLIKEGHPVHVVVHRGSRHDLGNPGGYLKAAVDFALDRDDYGPELRRWLVTRLGLAEASGLGRRPVDDERRAVRSVEEQQTRVSAAAVAPRPVRVAIAEAQGLLCAEEVVTEHPLPGSTRPLSTATRFAGRVLGVGQGDPSEDQADDEERSRGIVSAPAG